MTRDKGRKGRSPRSLCLRSSASEGWSAPGTSRTSSGRYQPSVQGFILCVCVRQRVVRSSQPSGFGVRKWRSAIELRRDKGPVLRSTSVPSLVLCTES